MTAAVAPPLDKGGVLVARRAVTRWAWRLFFREWRQQLLVLALIVVAVAATFVGSSVATNTPPPADAGFGTAKYMASYAAPDPHVAAQVAALERQYSPVDVIENQTIAVPGSSLTFQLRAQDPRGPYGQPMLSLVSGHFPVNAHEVAVTSGVASELGLHAGDRWHQGGTTRTVVGIVENPQSLLDEFALVAPGQVTDPTNVTVLFDAQGVPASTVLKNPHVASAAAAASSNPLNPETISLAVLTIGMLLIALVAIGGFTVLAQRRLRSLGMLASLGGTDRQVGQVVRSNGLVVGIVGAILGTVLGFVVWALYRASLEQSAHHVIGLLSLPWTVIIVAFVLAIGASYFAASRPARAIAKIPVVVALTGRPPAPRKIHRSAVPGLILLGAAFLLLGYSGGTAGGTGSGGSLELVLGLVLLVPAVVLLAPFCLSVVARVGRGATVGPRLALRDLNRYRARSGSALAAISIGVMIAVIVATVAAARYANVLDYAGPNVAANQLLVYNANSGYVTANPAAETPRQLAANARAARGIAASVGATEMVGLVMPNVSVAHSGGGRSWSGPIYLATPELLRAFGIPASSINPNADLLSMRPGLSGVAGLQLQGCERMGIGRVFQMNGPGQPGRWVHGPVCKVQTSISNPVVQEVGSLPSGTSAPNTVLTEHAWRTLGVTGTLLNGWLLQSPQAFTSAQVHDAQVAAAAANMQVESRNDLPTSATIVDWATVFGIAIALCILAMSVGLIRSETESDLRTLVANGAGPRTRRTLTAVTAGALGLLGAVLGTFAGYVGVIGWLRDNSLNGGISSLTSVPARNLLIILIGMPLVAAVGGWLLSWREPAALARQPIE